MPIPALVVALATAAAEAEAKNQAEAAQAKYNEEYADVKGETQRRQNEAEREAARRTAMTRALQAGPQPIDQSQPAKLSYQPGSDIMNRIAAMKLLQGASKGLSLYNQYQNPEDERYASGGG